MSSQQPLAGQTVLVIGGTRGIGLETAKLAREQGAKVIITARDPDRLHRVGLELGASIAAFDATNFERLERFFNELPTQVDHVLVTGPGPYHAPLTDLDIRKVHRNYDAHIRLPVQVARSAVGRVLPTGTLLFMSSTGGRRAAGGALICTHAAAVPALARNLALELAPIRVNVIAAGFVDTPLSAELLGDQLNAHRDHLRATLPIGRIVSPADVAALAVHLMMNTAVTGATFDIDGGQQLVAWRHTGQPGSSLAPGPRRRGIVGSSEATTRRSAVTTTTYLGSGDVSRHRRDYRPDWLDNLADDVTIEGSVLTGVAEGPEAIREILGFARTLYDYQEFNYVGRYGDGGFVEDYTSVVRGEPIGSVVVVRFNEAGQAARIVVNHRPLGSVLLWSQLMGEHFAGTRYAQYFLSRDAAEAHEGSP